MITVETAARKQQIHDAFTSNGKPAHLINPLFPTRHPSFNTSGSAETALCDSR
jgi:hypothetical protein